MRNKIEYSTDKGSQVSYKNCKSRFFALGATEKPGGMKYWSTDEYAEKWGKMDLTDCGMHNQLT